MRDNNPILRRARRRVRERLSDERGIALIMALGFMAVMAISTAAIATLVTSNEKAFSRDREETRALNIAEAGVNDGLAYINENVSDLGLPANTQVPSSGWQTRAYDGGSFRWRATKLSQDAASGLGTWVVTAVGTSPTGAVSRQVSIKTTATTTSTSFSASQAWTYGLFVASPSGCANMLGSVAVTMRVYIQGDLCMNGGASIANPPSGSKVSVFVGGTLTISGGPTIGASANRISNFTSVGGCKSGSAFSPTFCGSGTTPPGGSTSKVWADTYNTAQPAITKPLIYPAAIYTSGDWRNPVCSTGSFTFDTDTVRNTSVGNFTLMPSSSFDCTVYTNSSHTTVRGRLAWNNSTKVLTAQGTVFVDGNLRVTGGSGSYLAPELPGQGKGATLYVNGTVTSSGNSTLCGPGATPSGSACTGLWDASDGEALAIVAVNAGGASVGWSMTGNAEWNVISYVVGEYDDGGTAHVTGPIITDKAKVHGTPDTTDVLDPPDGAPGSAYTTQSAAWGTTLNGSWTQTPVGG